MTKPLNVGMIGYGFMGKAHSNAYLQVGRFFPELEHRPVLKCLCARNEDKARAFDGARPQLTPYRVQAEMRLGVYIF